MGVLLILVDFAAVQQKLNKLSLDVYSHYEIVFEPVRQVSSLDYSEIWS